MSFSVIPPNQRMEGLQAAVERLETVKPFDPAAETQGGVRAAIGVSTAGA
jgi:hypothetical protein